MAYGSGRYAGPRYAGAEATRTGTTTGSTTTGGNATGKAARFGVVNGTTVSAGSDSGSPARSGLVTGFTTTAGTATGKATRNGIATGSTATGGTATGRAGYKGTATGITLTTGFLTGRAGKFGTVTGVTLTSGTVTGLAAFPDPNPVHLTFAGEHSSLAFDSGTRGGPPMSAEYFQGSDLPDLKITWPDDTGAPINFSTGWTFTVKVGPRGGAALLTKTTGITGSATAPNLTVSWSTVGELNTLAPGVHTIQVTALRTSDNKERMNQGLLRVRPALT